MEQPFEAIVSQKTKYSLKRNKAKRRIQSVCSDKTKKQKRSPLRSQSYFLSCCCLSFVVVKVVNLQKYFNIKFRKICRNKKSKLFVAVSSPSTFFISGRKQKMREIWNIVKNGKWWNLPLLKSVTGICELALIGFNQSSWNVNPSTI